MNLHQVLMGSAGTLSVVTLLLMFTGNLWAMTVTAVPAVVLAAFALLLLASQEAREDACAVDR